MNKICRSLMLYCWSIALTLILWLEFDLSILRKSGYTLPFIRERLKEINLIEKYPRDKMWSYANLYIIDPLLIEHTFSKTNRNGISDNILKDTMNFILSNVQEVAFGTFTLKYQDSKVMNELMVPNWQRIRTKEELFQIVYTKKRQKKKTF
ncbi:hypothetical protein BC833DRAFT_419198 [Globomyces pollinis-pini]|nr:hypothetical protein BC833DRAFT_419198 [Globomyces pollinis-pini]